MRKRNFIVYILIFLSITGCSKSLSTKSLTEQVKAKIENDNAANLREWRSMVTLKTELILIHKNGSDYEGVYTVIWTGETFYTKAGETRRANYNVNVTYDGNEEGNWLYTPIDINNPR